MLFLIILILSIISGLFWPWWVAAIIAFVAAICCAKTSGQAFWSGFGAVFVTWVIFALIKSLPNDNKLATRVSHLFSLPNWMLLLLVTAIIGGLVGGLAALSGLLMREAVKKKE